MQLEDRRDCVTDLAFDRWFARELPPLHASHLEAHVQGCTRCRLRREFFERERAAFLAHAPSLEASAVRLRQLRNLPVARPARARRWLPFFAAASAGLGLLLALLPQLQEPSAEGLRRKGGFQFGFYIKRGADVQRGASGDTVYPSDRLGFTYSSTAPTYLAVLGRDPHTASVYYPASDTAVQLVPASGQRLDFSLELDARLGTELVFAVACPAPFSIAPLRAALERGQELSTPPGCRVERISLQKEAPR